MSMKNTKFYILFGFSIFVTGILWAESVKTPSALSKTLVIMGDSLTEGYGVARESSYPFLLEKKISEHQKKWKIVNSGIGGSTSASAPGRVNWVLKSKPDLVILFLGGNDALRGLPPQQMQSNLDRALQNLKEHKVKTVLVEMWAPPNYGEKYTKEFRSVFENLHKKYQLEFVSFPLGGIAGQKNLNQADGIHPNEKGHIFLADEIYKKIKHLL